MSNDPKRKKSTKKQAIASLIIETAFKISKNKGDNILTIMGEYLNELDDIMHKPFRKGGKM